MCYNRNITNIAEDKKFWDFFGHIAKFIKTFASFHTSRIPLVSMRRAIGKSLCIFVKIPAFSRS